MTERNPENGYFLPGNQFWKARSRHGRNPIFDTPEKLREACEDYFEWVDANPLYEDRLVTFQGSATHEPVAKMRAMTLGGLCLFIGISMETWYAWKRDRSDFSEIISEVENAIYTQKFTGAAADLLNANIISRELGLADKNEISDPTGSLTPPSVVRIVPVTPDSGLE